LILLWLVNDTEALSLPIHVLTALQSQILWMALIFSLYQILLIIKHILFPSSKVVLGITFVGHSYIVSGGRGQIWMSECESIRVLAGLQGQETSRLSQVCLS
jgi:hypothetical protein